MQRDTGIKEKKKKREFNTRSQFSFFLNFLSNLTSTSLRVNGYNSFSGGKGREGKGREEGGGGGGGKASKEHKSIRISVDGNAAKFLVLARAVRRLFPVYKPWTLCSNKKGNGLLSEPKRRIKAENKFY